MSDSHKPTYHHPTTMPQPPPPPQRLCDYCNTETAVLYCRADSAKLCLSCDREVHLTNHLFSKHTRSQLCDSCDVSPASIFCETEQSVFCQNCDWERHSVSVFPIHTRRPFEGFSGCPCVSELMTILGVDDLGYKKGGFFSEESDDGWFGYEDLLVWETPAVVSIDDLVVSSDEGRNFQALGVPPLPKNRNAVCGQHKEQVLHQLHELSRTESNSYLEGDVAPSNESLDAARSMQPQQQNAVSGVDSQPISVTKEEENLLGWFTDAGDDPTKVFVPTIIPNSNLEKSCTVKQSNISDDTNHANDDGEKKQLEQPITDRTTPFLPKVGSYELNSQERDSAISRYKEKRKTRRYDKHIRYESRKVRAESRIRVRGRFAKRDH